MVPGETEPPFNQAEGCGVIPGGREMLQCLEFMAGSKLCVSAELYLSDHICHGQFL